MFKFIKMKFSSFKVLLLPFFLLFVVEVVSKNEILIESPNLTDQGDWGTFDNCTPGTFASSFRLKSEKDQGIFKDDTALNAIKLNCVYLGSQITQKEIQSSVGVFGSFGSLFQCDGLLTGFQMRTERNGRLKDNTAANNIRFFCSDPKHQTIEGDGQENGEWTQSQSCPSKHAICGIQTQVQADQGGLDDTGLNNVKFVCCEVPNPGKTCKPHDSWELLYSCDNRDGKFQLDCSVFQKVGIEGSNSQTNSGSLEGRITKDIGFSTGSTIEGLKINFQNSLSDSKNTGHNWQQKNSNTWSETTTKSFSFKVPAGIKSDVYQVVGTCGGFTAYTSAVKKVDVKSDPMPSSSSHIVTLSTADKGF